MITEYNSLYRLKIKDVVKGSLNKVSECPLTTTHGPLDPIWGDRGNIFNLTLSKDKSYAYYKEKYV